MQRKADPAEDQRARRSSRDISLDEIGTAYGRSGSFESKSKSKSKSKFEIKSQSSLKSTPGDEGELPTETTVHTL